MTLWKSFTYHLKKTGIYSILTWGGISAISAQDGQLDLTQLNNYANQTRPAYIQKDNTPTANPITDMGATLGRVLFYDKRLSRNNTISCASCHQQAHAFGDTALASTGVNGTTGRHSMRLINARFSRESKFFWDERAASLEAQTTQPIQDHVEMGFSNTNGDPSFSDLITKLSLIEEYKVLFTAVYGDSGIDEDRIQKALGQFVRSIQSFDSKYDTGRAAAPNDAAPFTNFTQQENNGKNLFLRPPTKVVQVVQAATNHRNLISIPTPATMVSLAPSEAAQTPPTLAHPVYVISSTPQAIPTEDLCTMLLSQPCSTS